MAQKCIADDKNHFCTQEPSVVRNKYRTPA